MTAQPGWFALASTVAGVFAGVAVHYGWKNVKQGDVLANAIPFSRLEPNVGRCVALRGRPKTTYQGNDPIRRGRLWEKRTHEVYRKQHHTGTDGKHTHTGSWKTESSSEMGEDFFVSEGNVSVLVRNKPTEVHGTETATEDGGGAASFLVGTMDGARRTQVEWLPADLDGVTVCGRLVRDGRGYAITKDDDLGLLLSKHTPGSQASTEKAKGWFAIVGAPIAWLVGSWFLFGFLVRQG